MTAAKTDLVRNDPADPSQQQTVKVSPDDHPLYEIVIAAGFVTTEQLEADEQNRLDSHAYKTGGPSNVQTADLGQQIPEIPAEQQSEQSNTNSSTTTEDNPPHE